MPLCVEATAAFHEVSFSGPKNLVAVFDGVGQAGVGVGSLFGDPAADLSVLLVMRST